MASFEELQAIAAARSKASQEKLAAERASREAVEKAKKLAHDEKLRLDALKDREMMIAKEQRRKREEEERKKLEEEKKKRMEKREYEMRMKERETLDKAKFQNAAHKAFKKIRSSAKEKVPKGRRNESVSPPPNQREHSTLTREEKRQKKEAAMLGLTSSSKRKSHHSAAGPSSRAAQGNNGSLVGALHALGTNKRDTRTVDEIERDLIAARQERMKMQGRGVHRDRIGEEERKEQELEGMLRRKRAMAAKYMVEESATVPSVPVSEDDGIGERSYATRALKKKRDRSPIDERPTKHKKPSNPAISMPYGLSPADFLPGAPIRAVPKIVPKEQPEAKKVAQNGSKGNRIDKKRPSPEPTIPKKETARERFLREEAERKRKMASKSQRYEEDEDEDSDESNDDDDSDEESDEDTYESEEEEDLPRAKKSDVSRQIWQMFNRRDKSEYLARDIDSDDEDMEADMESVRREEARSAKLARLEDQREEAEQRRREQEKARRKAEKRRA